jgi:3,4-dihydroxy 2-butanone 4-phosphate synthase/GTP cyclohydrolase II
MIGGKVEIRNETVQLYSEANLPTQYGEFKIYVFQNKNDEKEHLAIVKGDLKDAKNVPVRLHSECLTSEVLGSLKCDCREQLEAALRYIAHRGEGLVIYLRQEGRGIGLGNKIRAYALQEAGYDTVQANHILGFPDDLRRYDVAAEILNYFGIRSVRLLTNNPNKIEGLMEYGIAVSDRIPLQIQPNDINYSYLMTKAKKSGHMLEFSDEMYKQLRIESDLLTDTGK